MNKDENSIICVGIIGGTGMKDMDVFVINKSEEVSTPYGPPSSPLMFGKIHGVECVLLSRHGLAHDTMPSNVNYRANIFALKQCGCTHVIATTACGSLQEEMAPGHFVILDQFIDRTTKRKLTFYDGDEQSLKGVMHIPMKNPFSPRLREVLISACETNGIRFHKSGTTVTIEGPRFSTFAESHLFKSWGASIVNMTSVPEVVLANELGMMYAAVAMVTDYDCWRESEEGVNVENVMNVMRINRNRVIEVLGESIRLMSQQDWKKDIAEANAVAKASLM